MRGVWVTNDKANHPIALVSRPGLRDYPQKPTLSRFQHVVFEYEVIKDLLDIYARLKKLGIEPVIAVDHEPTTSFY